MNWETPLALGLAMAIPGILVLWMLKPRRPRLRVSSLMLWPSSPAERQSARPWQRLRNHPLLWLQIVIAALLAVSAARPFLPTEASGQQLLVLLDASGSMRARDISPDRFTAAKAAVLEMARQMGPDQEMTVLRVDEQPRVLVANSRGPGRLEAALVEEQASYGSPDVAAALALATGLTDGPTEWVLIGDGGLALGADARRAAGTSFRFIPIGGQAANVAVTNFAIRRGDADLTLQAGLSNTGSAPISGRLQLLAEGELVAAQDWRLAPEANGHIVWSHLPSGPRWYEARLSGVPLEANALAQDDQAWVTSGASAESRLLLVTPGNTFLERVLSVGEDLRPFKVGSSDWLALAGTGDVYPLTVLDRLWPEAMPAGSSLLVGPPVGDEFRPREIRAEADHALLRHVDWSEVSVAKARKVPLDASWETVIDSDGGPLVAVRTEGGRRQAVLTFELGQSDLALRTAFPVLMVNMLNWLLPRSEDTPRTATAGSTIDVAIAPLSEQMWVEGLGGVRFDLAPPWPALQFRPPAPGLYRLVQRDPAGQSESFLIASGYNAQESNVAARAVDIPAAGDIEVPLARGAISLWPWLAVSLLLVSLVEWWVDAHGR